MKQPVTNGALGLLMTPIAKLVKRYFVGGLTSCTWVVSSECVWVMKMERSISVYTTDFLS